MKINSKFNSSADRQNSKLKYGFTMIELLVAMSVFIIIVGISIGIFVRSLRAQRNIITLMTINDNASLALEQMTREIRTGEDFSLLAEDQLKFTNYDGLAVTYRLNSATESLDRGLTDSFRPITSSEVKIKKLKFVLKGEDENDNLSTRVTIFLNVGSNQRDLRGITTNLQTTISAREF